MVVGVVSRVMRILGLDVGDKRIGVALSDTLGLTAQRLTVLERTALAADVEAVRLLVERHEVEAIVMGLPLTMQGVPGIQAQKVKTFADHLQRRVSVPVHLMDERLTTVQGQRALLATDTSRRRRKEIIDQVAAQLILQQFLDAQRPSAA